MNKFSVPPEYCLIINALNQAQSLRSAASLLGMDPPALVRKVRIISEEYGFLEKSGNRWIVNENGRRIAQWTDDMINSQAELLSDKYRIRITSFSWLAEETLIPNYSSLRKLLGGKHDCIFKITATDSEKELLQSRTDLVIQGHPPTDPLIAHKKVASLYWVVVMPRSWKKHASSLSNPQLRDFLNQKPFIRLESMNPESVLGFQPKTLADIGVDGVIGLRSAVLAGEGWSTLPAMSVARYINEDKLFKVDFQTHIKDDLSVWWLRSRKELSSPTKSVISWLSNL